MATKLTPTGSNLLIEVEPPEATRPTGLIVTGGDENPTKVATIIAVGPRVNGARTKDTTSGTTFRPGDKILFQKFKGSKVVFDGKEQEIISAADVLAVVTEEDD